MDGLGQRADLVGDLHVDRITSLAVHIRCHLLSFQRTHLTSVHSVADCSLELSLVRLSHHPECLAALSILQPLLVHDTSQLLYLSISLLVVLTTVACGSASLPVKSFLAAR